MSKKLKVAFFHWTKTQAKNSEIVCIVHFCVRLGTVSFYWEKKEKRIEIKVFPVACINKTDIQYSINVAICYMVCDHSNFRKFVGKREKSSSFKSRLLLLLHNNSNNNGFPLFCNRSPIIQTLYFKSTNILPIFSFIYFFFYSFFDFHYNVRSTYNVQLYRPADLISIIYKPYRPMFDWREGTHNNKRWIKMHQNPNQRIRPNGSNGWNQMKSQHTKHPN